MSTSPLTPAEFETLLESSLNAFFHRYHERLISFSFSNLYEKGTGVLCRAANWKGVDLRGPLLQALEGLKHTQEATDPEEQRAWEAAVARALYTPNHHLPKVLKTGISPHCHRVLMDWMRAVELQPGWEAEADPATLEKMLSPFYSQTPGLLETLELAVLQGPLRGVTDPAHEIAWAASALQQQRLHVFESMKPDPLLMANVIATARPVRDPELNRTMAGYRDCWLQGADSNKYRQELQRNPDDTHLMSWLWQEWLHDPFLEVPVHQLAQRLGVSFSSCFSMDQTCLSIISSADVFEMVVATFDPIAAHQPWPQRLGHFIGLGPACIAWRKEIPDTWRDQWPEERPWLLDYLYQRWSQWTPQEQILGLNAWKLQALTGWGPQGMRGASTSVSFTNTNAGWMAGDMEDVTQWAANARGTKQNLAGWHHPILLPTSPVAEWIHPDGSQEPFAAGYFRTALHAPVDSMRLPANSAWLALRTPTPEEDLLRLVFSLGCAPMARTFLKLHHSDGSTGERLAELLREILGNVNYPNCDVLVDVAAVGVLQAWIGRENMLSEEAWESFSKHATGLAQQLLDRKRLSLLLLLEWAEQAIPATQAICVSHFILRMVSDSSTMDRYYRGEEVEARAIEALVNAWCQLEVGEDDLPEGIDRQLWRQATASRRTLNLVQVGWRQRLLQQSLPGPTGGQETKARL